LLQIILDAVDKPRVISFKGAADLVTETDKRSEEAIIKVPAAPHAGAVTACLPTCTVCRARSLHLCTRSDTAGASSGHATACMMSGPSSTACPVIPTLSLSRGMRSAALPRLCLP